MLLTRSKRGVVVLAPALLGLAAMLSAPAIAQQFPSQPVKIVVGFGAGGTTDAITRLYAHKLSEILKTPVIVDNKPGGNQAVAIATLLNSRPDGHTLYAAVGSTLVHNPALRKDLSYDPLKSFTLVGLAVTNPAVIFVSPDLPVRSVKELAAYAAAHPGKLNYGSAGIGTAGHLAVELFQNITGAKMNHIPYKSDIEVVREVISGNVQVGIFATLNTVSFIKSGKIRPLAVTTSNRLPYLPDVPTLAEVDVKGLAALDPHTFVGFIGPAGMPPAVVAQLNDAINKVSATPEVATRVRDTLYAEPATSTPASFREFVERELAKWKAIGKNVKLPE